MSKPKNPKKCWIVELWTATRGWEPCYESEVNSSRAWAKEDRDRLAKKYAASRYRVAQYEQRGTR